MRPRLFGVPCSFGSGPPEGGTGASLPVSDVIHSHEPHAPIRRRWRRMGERGPGRSKKIDTMPHREIQYPRNRGRLEDDRG